VFARSWLQRKQQATMSCIPQVVPLTRCQFCFDGHPAQQAGIVLTGLAVALAGQNMQHYRYAYTCLQI
jgi:hypothetical protein